jgi:serine/threonine-protein kinase HipA
MNPTIEVYYDWNAPQPPAPLGTLRTRPGRTGELVDFRFDDAALSDPTLAKLTLDPDVMFSPGPQFPRSGRSTFGLFADSSPDRWGRTLIRRRFDRDKRNGVIPVGARLGESDYLLGVHDAFRSGALRYRRDVNGPFLDDRYGGAAPPLVRLRELEAAARTIEEHASDDSPDVDASLLLLLAPGASLGGARPKATVVDPQDNLWIAKFPSLRDEFDVGAWELVVATLATRCGLSISRCEARTFAGSQHTFLTQRFDRRERGARVHFASAMTLTGHEDGDGAATGASYLEIAEVIVAHGAATNDDLLELWSRIVFNALVSNSDDHLRNHGFLLSPQGWRLSPAYDMNPAPGSTGLALNIDESDNALDLDLIRSVAPYFRVTDSRGSEIIDRFSATVRDWRDIAGELGIARSEQNEMADAFALARR